MSKAKQISVILQMSKSQAAFYIKDQRMKCGVNYAFQVSNAVGVNLADCVEISGSKAEIESLMQHIRSRGVHHV